jgi:RNA polymerase sigma factor (TIGR02999 family)
MGDVTLILQAMGRSEPLASEQLLPLVYEELRRLAAVRMAQEAAGQTLQATALVHEAWLRLVQEGDRTWNNRAHFFRAAAQAMRRILIERARHKASLKGGGGLQRLNVEELDIAALSPDDQLLLIDESLERLEREDPESAQVVMLKFFTGLTNKEAARTLGVSESTVERQWAFAKACLFQMIREAESGQAGRS